MELVTYVTCLLRMFHMSSMYMINMLMRYGVKHVLWCFVAPQMGAISEYFYTDSFLQPTNLAGA